MVRLGRSEKAIVRGSGPEIATLEEHELRSMTRRMRHIAATVIAALAMMTAQVLRAQTPMKPTPDYRTSPASGITCSRTAGLTASSPVNGRLCAAIRTIAMPTLVAKMVRMMRHVTGLSL